MSLHAVVRRNQYQDSVRLMNISRQASALDGVNKVLAMLGTDSNKKVLADLALMDETVAQATANDLVICVDAQTPMAVDDALAEVDALLRSATQGGVEKTKPASLEEGVEALPGANFAMISLPGQMAKLDVLAALERGLNVMLFSDNISLADEAQLKKLAVSRDLLLMGPDCGTAIINGVPLALANVVRRGAIGLAAASGTGIQEVTCLVDRFGGGISHAIGVGGRDLRKEVGGEMMRFAIRTLAADPATTSLILLSKPGDPGVMRAVLDEARASGLAVVACLLGGDAVEGDFSGMRLVRTLEEAAFAAMERTPPALSLPPEFSRRAHAHNPARRHLRGLYSGGTLCYESLFLLKDHLDIHSNVALTKALKLEYPAKGTAHCLVDLGEDEFTQGRPHPIIDLGLRLERLAEDMRDPTVKVVLLDVVLGYGANRDPAGQLAQAVTALAAEHQDGGPLVIAHVCGAQGDPQSLEEQERTLARAGVFLFPTNAQAAQAALAAITGQGLDRGHA